MNCVSVPASVLLNIGFLLDIRFTAHLSFSFKIYFILGASEESLVKGICCFHRGPKFGSEEPVCAHEYSSHRGQVRVSNPSGRWGELWLHVNWCWFGCRHQTQLFNHRAISPDLETVLCSPGWPPSSLWMTDLPTSTSQALGSELYTHVGSWQLHYCPWRLSFSVYHSSACTL